MPRTRKTQRGPAAGVQQIAGQEYGKGVEQVALEQAMPTPDMQGRPMGQQPAPVAAGQPQGAPVAPPSAPAADPYTLAMQQAQSLRGQLGLLNQPTGRPTVPTTNGLPSGPGAGPEILPLARASRTGQFLRELAEATGNAYYAGLADRIRA